MTEQSLNRIKEHRQRLGLSAKQLAEKIGANQSTLSRLEGGKQALTQDWIAKISAALSVTPNDLFHLQNASEFLTVIGLVSPGHWFKDVLYDDNRKRLLPFPKFMFNDKGDVYAFDMLGFSLGCPVPWVGGIKETKLSATNHIDKYFIVHRTDGKGLHENAIRKLENGADGLYLSSEGGDPTFRLVRFDDEKVLKLWRLAWKLECFVF